MKGFRLATMLLIGIAYAVYTMNHPEHKGMARVVALSGLVVVWAVTRLIAGKEAAATDPMAPDPIQSMNLSALALERLPPKDLKTPSA